MLTATFPPLKGGRGDVLFEGSPRAGAAEYVHSRDVNNQIRKSNKKIPISQKKDCPFWGQSITDVPIC